MNLDGCKDKVACGCLQCGSEQGLEVSSDRLLSELGENQ